MRRPTALRVFALLLLAAVGLAVWLGRSDAPGEPAPPSAAPQTTEQAPATASVREPQERREAAVAEPRERVEPVRAESDASQGARGRIVDDRGTPIPGAQVALLDSFQNDPLGKFLQRSQQIPDLALAAGQTDDAGFFALGLRTPTDRKLQLCVVAEGFAADTHGELVVQPETWLELGDLTLTRGCTIRGRVTVAGTDLPAPQAIVALAGGNPFVDAGPAQFDSWPQRRFAAVDAAGRYEIRHAPQQGVFRLQASAPGFGRQIRDEIDLTGRAVVEVDFALPRGLSVRGRLDTGGLPLTAVKITLFPKTAEPPFEGRAEADGTFAIHGLRDGPHLLQIAADGFQPVERDDVTAGTQDLVIPLVPRGRGGVRVLAADGSVLRRYRLAVRRWFEAGGGQIGTVRDVPERVVRLDPPAEVAFVEGLEDGEFVFQVEADGHVATLSPPLRIDAAHRHAEVTVQLHRGGAIAGVVLGGDGLPLEGARVRTEAAGAAADNPVWRMLQGMTPDRITRTETTTGADGSFVLRPLAHARYQIAVDHADHCRAVRDGIEITEDRTETAAPFRLVRGCAVSGRAVAAGLPAAQVQVVLTPLHNDPGTGEALPKAPAGSSDETSVARVEAVTNPEGRFELPRRIPPGVYELRGVSLSGAGSGADVFQKILQMKKSSVRLEIGPGQPSAEVELRLDG